MAENELNGLSKKREMTAQKIIQALGENAGLLTAAAKKAGVSYTTMQRYVKDCPTVKDAVIEAKERMLDFTESKLFEKIKNGDTACIIFYLKTQGKKRGYVERQEITGEDGKPFTPPIITLETPEGKEAVEAIVNGEGTE